MFDSCLPSVDAALVPHNLIKFIDTDADADTQDFNCTHSATVLFILSYSFDDKFEFQMILDRGNVSDWPVHFMHPCKLNVRVTPAFLGELRTFFNKLYGNECEYVQPRIGKYGRCIVNGQKFSSDFNSTDRGSIVKAMFVDGNNELAPYFGIVRFYFTVTTVINAERRTHQLAYVTWLKFRSLNPERLSKLFRVTNQEYQGDRIISPRRFICRCVLVSTKPTVPLYFVSELSK